MLLKKTAGHIFGERKKIISKIKTEQHYETYDLPSFMENPAAQMLKKYNNHRQPYPGARDLKKPPGLGNTAQKCVVFVPFM